MPLSECRAAFEVKPALPEFIPCGSAAMAVLRQQSQFTERLFETGMISEVEMAAMQRPIDRRERRLVGSGPNWRTPMVFEVLQALPFFREVGAICCCFDLLLLFFREVGAVCFFLLAFAVLQGGGGAAPRSRSPALALLN
jgi:hypothetical protein